MRSTALTRSTSVKKSFNGLLGRLVDSVFDHAKNTLTSEDYNALHRWYASELQQAISQELPSDIAYNTPDFEMQVNLRSSLAVFASYKSYHHIQSLNAALFDAEGKPRTKSQFIKSALEINKDFSVRYLSTEYNDAIAKAQTAAQWLDIERNADIAPWLRYDTAGDLRVRPEHAALDGITKRYDDTWWLTHTPPLGHNCRCTVSQDTDGHETPSKNIPAVKVTPGFGHNPLKNPVVFNESHPYFSRVDEKDRDAVKALGDRLNFKLEYASEYGALLKSAKFQDINAARVVATGKKLAAEGDRVVLVSDRYFNNTKGKNPEVELNGVAADIKHFNQDPTIRAIQNHIKKAAKQYCETVVIDFEDHDYDSDIFNMALENAERGGDISKDKGHRLTKVVLIKKGDILEMPFDLK